MDLKATANREEAGVDSTTRWWRDHARSEMGAQYAEHTTGRDAGWADIAASGADDVARMAQAFRHGPGLDALEIGCGVGRLTANLAPLFRSVVAADISAEVVNEAAVNCARSNVTFEVINGVELLPGKEECFDVVFSAETFHHIQPPVFRQYLHDSFRLLRPGGQLALHVNVEANTARARVGQLVRRVLSAFGVRTWRGWPTNPGFRRQHYRGAEVMRMMTAAGFASPRKLGPYDRQTMFLADKPG